MIRPIALNLLFGGTLLSQSSFELRNYSPPLVNAPVFDAQGVPLAGPDYLAELWGAATPDALEPALDLANGSRRVMVPFSTGGYFIGGTVDVNSIPPVGGGWAWLQVRAWDARLGATFEDAAAGGLGGYGESALFYAKGSDPFLPDGQLPGHLIGLQSFNLLPEVPEPSTWALLVCGGLGFWLAARGPRRWRFVVGK